MAKKVFIGVGHGGSDPGAVANGHKEAALNLLIALACQDELVRHGVTVQLSRTTDEEDTLAQEVAECNAFGPDLAVDVHNNAGGGDGAEAFYSIDGSGKALAQNILTEIVAIGQNSRGAKTRKNSAGTADYYGFIRNTSATAVIVECAFVDNTADMKILDTTAEQRAMGAAIAKGILKTLGINYINEEEPEMQKYNTIDEVPDWGKATVQKLVDSGALKGTGNGLDLSYDMLRILVILDRLGKL